MEALPHLYLLPAAGTGLARRCLHPYATIGPSAACTPQPPACRPAPVAACSSLLMPPATLMVAQPSDDPLTQCLGRG